MKELNSETGDLIAGVIENRIMQVAKEVYKNTPNNRTKFGKVISKKGAIFTVEIDRAKYSNVKALRNVGDIKVGEIVTCLIPNNQFSNILILGVADGTLDKATGSGSVNIVDNLTSTSTTDALSANQGRVLNSKIIPIVANSGEPASENLAQLKLGNKNYAIPTGSGSVNIVDNLTSTSTTDALSANQGRVLNEKIKTNTNSIINLNESITSNTESINDLQQQIEDLEFSPDEIKQIKSDINTIKNETLVELNAQVELNTQDISSLENITTQLDDKVDTFDNRITNNTNAINEHTININTLRAGVLSNENAIIALRDDLNSLEINPDEINSLRNQVTQATEKVEEIELTVDSLDNRVKENTERSEQNKLKIESNADRIKTNQEKIQELEEKIDNNIPSNEEINQMKQDIEDNKTAISKNEQNISTNNALINTVIGTLEDFETLITTNTTNIEENKQDINTNTQQIENINKRLDNFNIQPEDIQQLQQSVENLSKEIPDIKSDIENNQTLIQSNKTNIDNHTEILNTHTTNINENTTTIQQHNQEIETINDKINKLNLSPDDVANLKESVEQFNVDINNLQESVTKNTSNIAINTENITDNSSKIETNRLNIESNLQKINTNSENIAKNTTDISNKQEQLVAGVNIKTFNGQSLLGEGNIEFAGANFDNQLSLESENAVQNKVITEALNEKVSLKGDEFIEGQKTFDNIPLVNTAIKLPDGYIPLSYVGVKDSQDGYPYFDTNMGLLVGYNKTFHLHLKFKRSGNYFGEIFSVPEFSFRVRTNTTTMILTFRNLITINLTSELNEIITLDIDYNVDTRRLNYTISNSSTTISDYFEQDKVWSSYSTARLLEGDSGYASYEFLELWETKDGSLAYNLVPALRTSDNMAGFYDVVNNVFTANARGTMQGITYGEELKTIEKLALLSDIPEVPEIPEIEINNGQPTTETMNTFSFNGVNYALPSGGEGGGSSVEINSTDTPVGVANFIKVNGLNYEIGGNGCSGSGGSSLPIGSIFASALPQTDTGVHLLDGSTIALDGIYAEFVNLFKTLVTAGYNLTCTQEEYDTTVAEYGQCGKFVLNEENNKLRLPIITEFIASNNGGQEFGLAQLDEFKAHTHEIKNDNGQYVQISSTNGSNPGGKITSNTAYYPNTNEGYTVKAQPSSGGDETRPKNIRYPYYIVLANATKTTGGGLQNIYSTEETIIGKWIDGRPIYRKVFTGTFGSVGNYIMGYIQDIKTLVNSYGYYVQGQYLTPINTTFNSDLSSVVQVDNTNGQIIVAIKYSLVSKEYTYTFEYTKTTD